MGAPTVPTALIAQQFVTRSYDTLKLEGRPFYFLGTNAYYLIEQAARGDTQTVKDLFHTARSLNMTVVRTWAFYDSPDSVNPAVIQYRPGAFNEVALRGLDYVLLQARIHNIRVLLPLVNNWDDYGGMNQYIRWRASAEPSLQSEEIRYRESDLDRTIHGGSDRSYRYAINPWLGHDQFYSDSIIKTWYKGYVTAILQRINVFTGLAYRDDPFLFGWELANEPRSSDRSGNLVRRWVEEMANHIKSLDPNHLVGTGEEGFDITSNGYSSFAYNNQNWLFDGTAGVAFFANCVIQSIDFGSCHLYPEVWNLPKSAGGVWIRDHAVRARSAGKPLIVGEFGVREQQAATYESWLTTTLYDGAAGAMVWQLLEGPRTDREGYGIRCTQSPLVCSRLREVGGQFNVKSTQGTLPAPQGFSLRQNYPNPFNGVTTIAYSLPVDAMVNLSIWNAVGQHVRTIVDARQSAGERRELFDGTMLASGAYFYRLNVGSLYRETRKLILMH